MKLAIVCNEYPPGAHGGIGTATRNLARALVARGHSVRVAGIYARTYEAPDYEDDQGVKVWRLRCVNGFGQVVRNRARLFRQIKEWVGVGQADIVDVPDYEGMAAWWPNLSAPLVGRICGAASYFQDELGLPVSPLSFRIEKRSLHRCHFWCAKSRYAAERAERFFDLPAKQVSHIYNAAPLSNLPIDRKRSRFDVVFANTLTAKKGIISLFKAWPAVLKVQPKARLHIYGKDRCSMEEQVTSIIAPLDRDSIQFYGHVGRPVVEKALTGCRLAIFPSYAESFGNAPVEAMAAGCPTIYTRLSCGPEIVRDEVDGLLVDPDNIREISSAIIRLLGDDALCERLGNAGRARVAEQFDPELIALKNELFYAQCVDQFNSPAIFRRRDVLGGAPRLQNLLGNERVGSGPLRNSRGTQANRGV